MVHRAEAIFCGEIAHRKVDPELGEGLLPGENVLIDAVDERSVKVEEHGGKWGRELDHRLGHVAEPVRHTPIRAGSGRGQAVASAVADCEPRGPREAPLKRGSGDRRLSWRMFGEGPDVRRRAGAPAEDRKLIAKRRGEANRLGFALQLTTVRFLGAFLDDPLEVPSAVLDELAVQLEIADPSCVKTYVERVNTKWERVRQRP